MISIFTISTAAFLAAFSGSPLMAQETQIGARNFLWGTGRLMMPIISEGVILETSSPLILSELDTEIVAVSAGSRHAVFIDKEGTLWGMGDNSNGQLGNGAPQAAFDTPIKLATGVKDIAVNDKCTVYLKSDGTLWGSGSPDHKELGIMDLPGENGFFQMASNVIAVSMTYNRTIFVKDSDESQPGASLWGVGLGVNREAGSEKLFDVTTGIRALSCGGNGMYFIGNDGVFRKVDETLAGAEIIPKPVDMAEDTEFVDVAVGDEHTLVLGSDGSLSGMGRSNIGQLGSIDTTYRTELRIIRDSGVSTISAGYAFSLFTDQTGTAWAMGSNTYGQLGIGNKTDSGEAVQVTDVPHAQAVFAGKWSSFIYARQPQGETIFVDYEATEGDNTGESWENAFTNLTDALSNASPGNEIWVAEGTYLPSATGDRTASFDMRNGVSVFGGFVGTETSRSKRNWADHQTFLSGHINGHETNAYNSYHVVSSNKTGAALLDGFIITGGNADGDAVEDKVGGGVYYDSAMTIMNCTFTGNHASTGGSVLFNAQGNVGNCEFLENGSNTIFSLGVDFDNCYFDAQPGIKLGQPDNLFAGKIKNCLFKDNEILNICTKNLIQDCIFDNCTGTIEIKNSGELIDSEVVDGNCRLIISGTSPIISGLKVGKTTANPFLRIADGTPSFKNCLFYGNAGGLLDNSTGSSFINCTYVNNGAAWQVSGEESTIRNCILWGNNGDGEQIDVTGTGLMLEYSCIMGDLQAGTENINLDPQFVGSGNNDFHLLDTSPCIDTGDPASPLGSDLDGVKRIVRADMGCYEGLVPKIEVTGQSLDFGEINKYDGQSSLEFIIKNTGTADLTLADDPITISETTNFTISGSWESTIEPNSSTSFLVTFDPSTIGLRQATITVISDDFYVPTHSFAIQGTGIVQDIQVSAGSGTNFGSEHVMGNSVERTFTITNTGTDKLSFTPSTPIVIGGENAGDFRFNPLSVMDLAPNADTELTIYFDPQELGTRTATVSIYSDDQDETPVTLALSGIGTNQTPIAAVTYTPADAHTGAPILLSGSNSKDPDNYPTSALTYSWQLVSGPDAGIFQDDMINAEEISWTTSTRGKYTFELTVGDGEDTDSQQVEVIVFGTLNLEIPMELREGDNEITCRLHADQELVENLLVTIASTDNSQVRVPAEPLTLGPGNNSLEFTIVVIDDNEIEAMETIEIRAEADQWFPASTAVSILDNEAPNAVVIGTENGGVNNKTHFDIAVSDVNFAELPFKILNTGTAPLNLAEIPIITTGKNANDFVVVMDQPVPSSIGVNDELPFVIRFIPTGEGATRQATVSILADDSDASVYEFDVTGDAIVYTQPGEASGDDGGGCGIGNTGSSDGLLFMLAGLVCFAVFLRCRTTWMTSRD